MEGNGERRLLGLGLGLGFGVRQGLEVWRKEAEGKNQSRWVGGGEGSEESMDILRILESRLWVLGRSEV